MKKILLAGIVGGIVMFVWSAIVIMVLPGAPLGVKPLPNETALLIAMKTSITEPGFYYYPGLDMSSATPEQQSAWEQKYKTGPAGIIVYRPIGGEPMSPMQFANELCFNILGALVAAWVLSLVVASYGTKVMLTAFLGLLTWFSFSLSYWNCYGFPTAYIGGELIDQLGGWFLAGLVMAKMVKPRLA